jgi:acetyl-CoA C-acetyltransferase
MVSRFCASGLEAVAYAARRIMVDGVPVSIAGGVESISLVGPNANKNRLRNEWLEQNVSGIYMPMIETADNVAARYGISREQQDEYSLESQRRTATAQQAGIFRDEIVLTEATKLVTDKETGEVRKETVRLTQDEGNRPDTNLEGLAKLKPVREGQFITAGNASQLSDGASVNLLMSAKEAEKRGLEVLGVFRGFASAGCEPDEMGIGPVFAIPRLLERHGLSVDDIDLWELNEAFASQVVYCRDKLGIPSDRLNVNGGAISIGHPFGMSGSRMVGHILLEGRRRRAKYGVATMCVAGGMGCAGLIEFQ